MITQKSIDEVFDAAHIEDVVGDVVNLKRAGVNLKGLCPFHSEKTPSFVVSPGKNLFKCFGCGKGGNPVHFLMEHDGLTFPEAIRRLAERYRIELEETNVTDEDREEANLKESLYLLNAFAGKYYQEQLLQNEEGQRIGLSYFRERGFLEKTIRQFGLGFAPGDSDALTQAATRANYNPEYLKKLGLTTESGRDFFRNRVMFPIHGINGRIVAFAGRIMGNNPRAPKYINSPESDIYNKSSVLYGAWFAKNAIRKFDECILVEGYTDVISLFQAGIENVVASSGTSLTAGQVRLVRRFSRNIKLLYDGDKAGIKAAMRGVDIILEEDMNVRIVVLPEGEDPDSYVQRVGLQAFQEYLENQSNDFILFKTGLLLQEAGDDPIRKANLVRSIVESIILVPDAIKRSLYIKECAGMLGIPEEVLVDETNKLLIQHHKKKKRADQNNTPINQDAPESGASPDLDTVEKSGGRTTSVPQRKTVNSAAFRERDLIRVLVAFGNELYDPDRELTIGKYIINQIEEVLDEFSDPHYGRIVQEIRENLVKDTSLRPDHFTGHADQTIRDKVIEILTSPDEFSLNWEQKWGIILQTQPMPEKNYKRDTEIVLRQFLIHKLNEMCAINLKSIKQLEEAGEMEDVILHIRVQQELLQRRNNLAGELNQVILG